MEPYQQSAPGLSARHQADRQAVPSAGGSQKCRGSIANALYERRIKAYCEEKRLVRDELDKTASDAVLVQAKADFEAFLGALIGKAVTVPKKIFDPTPTGELSVESE